MKMKVALVAPRYCTSNPDSTEYGVVGFAYLATCAISPIDALISWRAYANAPARMDSSGLMTLPLLSYCEVKRPKTIILLNNRHVGRKEDFESGPLEAHSARISSIRAHKQETLARNDFPPLPYLLSPSPQNPTWY